MADRKEFLNSIKEGAIQGWIDYQILPSITGAHGALERANGTSVLAEASNNVFGIKGDYNRYGYLHDTWEVDENGNKFNSTEWFRHYPDIATSVIDHGEFFTSTDWRKDNYQDVIGETDYKKAAQALKDAGYATDPDYPSKLISIIEDNNLVEWDKEALIQTGHAKKSSEEEQSTEAKEGEFTLDGDKFKVEEIKEDK